MNAHLPARMRSAVAPLCLVLALSCGGGGSEGGGESAPDGTAGGEPTSPDTRAAEATLDQALAGPFMISTQIGGYWTIGTYDVELGARDPSGRRSLAWTTRCDCWEYDSTLVADENLPIDLDSCSNIPCDHMAKARGFIEQIAGPPEGLDSTRPIEVERRFYFEIVPEECGTVSGTLSLRQTGGGATIQLAGDTTGSRPCSTRPLNRGWIVFGQKSASQRDFGCLDEWSQDTWKQVSGRQAAAGSGSAPLDPGYHDGRCDVPGSQGDTPPSPTPSPASSDRITIPEGRFVMGRGANGNQDYSPAHEVVLSEFSIDRIEVSVARYRACVESDECHAPPPDHDCTYLAQGNDELPVDCVTRVEARDYCRQQGGRLPTEAEWEKAARGTEARDYPWGNDRDPTRYIPPEAPVAVGTTRDRSPYGVQEMGSNVLEWVADYYDRDFYSRSPSRDPFNGTPALGDWVVFRGDGGLTWTRRYVSVSFSEPRLPGVGFRCAYSG